MKQLKKFWISLALLFTVETHAISIDLIPNTNQLNVGEQLQIAVMVSGVNDNAAPSLAAYDMDVRFDENRFAYNSIHWGDRVLGNQLDINGFGTLHSTSLSNNLINLFELSLDDQYSLNLLQAGQFTMFTLLFDAIDTGSSHIELAVNALADSNAVALNASNMHSIAVKVNAIEVPEPSGLLQLVGLIAMVLLRIKMTQSLR